MTNTLSGTKIGRSDQRMAVGVAHRISRLIVDAGWRVGHHLGTEPELLRILGVSRKTFREAVRILEQQDLVGAETGRHGGLIVKAPALEAVALNIRNHLELTGISFGEVVEAYRLMYHLGIALAIKRMTPAHANDLRAALSVTRTGRQSRDAQSRQATAVTSALFAIAGNPALTAFNYMFYRLLADFAHQERYPSTIWKEVNEQARRYNEQLVEQVCARDVKAAETIDAMLDYVCQVVERLEKRNRSIWNRQSFLHGAYESVLVGVGRSKKAALATCYRVAADIQRGSLKPGTNMGGEAELAERYHTSRATIAETLRMLEFLGVIRVRRGRWAGAQVIEPDPSAVVDAAVLYLSYFAPLRDDLLALREAVESAAIDLAAERLSHQDAAGLLGELLADCQSSPDTVPFYDFWRRLLAFSRNRTLTILICILVGAEEDDRDHAAEVDIAAVMSSARRLLKALDAVTGSDVREALAALVKTLREAAGSAKPVIAGD